MQIDGKVAIVTGAGSGLGAATAAALAARGARVGVLDFDGDKAEAQAARIGGVALRADVSDAGQVEAAFAKLEAEAGAPRIAVNCAGIGTAARIVGREGKLSIELFQKTIAVNLTGSFIVMSHAARAMQGIDIGEDEERGVIINTASAAFEDGQLGQAGYAASKGGIASMSLPAAREMARFGIRVMAIAPGLFYTPMMEGLPEETIEGITANIPFPSRLGKPEEYGQMACQIVENPYLNGTLIRLDGAVRLPPR